MQFYLFTFKHAPIIIKKLQFYNSLLFKAKMIFNHLSYLPLPVKTFELQLTTRNIYRFIVISMLYIIGNIEDMSVEK